MLTWVSVRACQIRIVAAQALTTMTVKSVLDEMYSAQDELIKEMRNHDNAKKEWRDEELKKLYETRERLLDLLMILDFNGHLNDDAYGDFISGKKRAHLAVATGIADLIYEKSKTRVPDLIYETVNTRSAEPDALDDDLVNFWAANLADDGAPAMNRVRINEHV
ncbi:hypothetical protein SASPL_152102 [Salvia splendens]|uniref:Uncharacterized protein n=1 Tax=Salvia splendens TaxID=180675 RepID=A0A8X8YZQ8_SALSN|nr:hypothetical protein SASPL_152102 [Salvia splendens]